MSSLSLPSPTLSTPAWRIAVVGCAFSLIWSSAFIAGKQAMTGCGPFTLLSLRFLAAGALLWLLRRWLHSAAGRQWWQSRLLRLPLMGPLARALDVTTHELTHAVTSSTAQLAYQNESGALNESVADIFGAGVETWVASGGACP